jgi:hypothetical protein
VHSNSEEKPRIVEATLPNGDATVQHYDSDGQARIGATTFPTGRADMVLSDGKGGMVWGEKSE